MKNILILTPDRVGSTLLQRLITVYAYFNNASAPTPAINVHELSNGIESNFSQLFQTNIVSKRNSKWSYYQSLPQITDILESANHPIIARLAKYHMVSREDSKIDQMKFYEYLNENFFIISARRFNAFEQAISWCIVGESKKLNVYSPDEKHLTFAEIYRNGIRVDPYVLKDYLQDYLDYESWSTRHFNINAHFYYDQHFEDVENYILNLNPLSHVADKKTWRDFSDLDFHDWNRIHYLSSIRKSQHKLLDSYSNEDINLYHLFKSKIQDLVKADILPTMVPYKLQTLKEKSSIITNFDECIEAYREWTFEKGLRGYSSSELTSIAEREDAFYNQTSIKPIEVPNSFLKN